MAAYRWPCVQGAPRKNPHRNLQGPLSCCIETPLRQNKSGLEADPNSLPAPMCLELLGNDDEDAGQLWAYFVLHGLDDDDELPIFAMTE
mmetsp:Transcript_92226/g.127106  ORF Transcript_92226/g.127106 Transcript_92226/m.127106 type:complete len:89 (-) Transcript_92226:56-322(-)